MRQSVVALQRHMFWYRWTTVCLKDMILELVHVYSMLDPGNCIVARNFLYPGAHYSVHVCVVHGGV